MKITKAFSLVELLVVMAVIAILLSMSAYGIQILTRNGRNSKRVDFVNDVKIGIEQFYIQNGRYPTREELASAFNTSSKEFSLDLNRSEPYTLKYGDKIFDPISQVGTNGTVYCYNSQRGTYILGIKKEGGTEQWQDIGNNPSEKCSDLYNLVASTAKESEKVQDACKTGNCLDIDPGPSLQ